LDRGGHLDLYAPRGIPIIPLYLAKDGRGATARSATPTSPPGAFAGRTIDEIIAELDTPRRPSVRRAMDHEAEDAFERLRVSGFFEEEAS